MRDTPGAALKRNGGVALTVCLFAWFAVLPAHGSAALQSSRSPSPEGLWKAYPLDPTAEPAPKQTSSPAASSRTSRRPVGAARANSDGGAPVFVLVLLALVTAGGMLTFVGIHRRREREPAAAAVPMPPRPAAGGHPVPALWHGPSARFSRTATKATARATATATVAAAQGPDGSGPGAADDPPRRAGKPSPVTPVVAPAGSPPDPRLTWSAEIEWRQIDGTSRFCVIARGAGTVEIAQSPPLDWPPDGPAAVQAVTNAADELAATLVGAGWKPLPPGSAWYAKRFAWEPAASAETSPGRPTAAMPAPDRVRGRRARAKQLVLLGVLAVVGLIAALQLGDGSDGAGAARAAPNEGTDLSVPLLALVGVILLVLAIRQFRSVLRRTAPRGAKSTRSRR